jgi:hypothetical protein
MTILKPFQLQNIKSTFVPTSPSNSQKMLILSGINVKNKCEYLYFVKLVDVIV